MLATFKSQQICVFASDHFVSSSSAQDCLPSQRKCESNVDSSIWETLALFYFCSEPFLRKNGARSRETLSVWGWASKGRDLDTFLFTRHTFHLHIGYSPLCAGVPNFTVRGCSPLCTGIPPFSGAFPTEHKCSTLCAGILHCVQVFCTVCSHSPLSTAVPH